MCGRRGLESRGRVPSSSFSAPVCLKRNAQHRHLLTAVKSTCCVAGVQRTVGPRWRWLPRLLREPRTANLARPPVSSLSRALSRSWTPGTTAGSTSTSIDRRALACSSSAEKPALAESHELVAGCGHGRSDGAYAQRAQPDPLDSQSARRPQASPCAEPVSHVLASQTFFLYLIIHAGPPSDHASALNLSYLPQSYRPLHFLLSPSTPIGSRLH